MRKEVLENEGLLPRSVRVTENAAMWERNNEIAVPGWNDADEDTNNNRDKNDEDDNNEAANGEANKD